MEGGLEIHPTTDRFGGRKFILAAGSGLALLVILTAAIFLMPDRQEVWGLAEQALTSYSIIVGAYMGGNALAKITEGRKI